MMLVDRLQESAGDQSKWHGVEEYERFNSKNRVLKGPAVIQPIMNVRWKMEDRKRLGNWKVTSRGEPEGSAVVA